MAGTLAVILQQTEQTPPPLSSLRNQWAVTFSRFFLYPTIISTCQHLKPQIINRRNLRSEGTWISSASPTASLQLSNSPSDAILTVCFEGKIFEEHYVSNLHYTWPLLQCDPECPVRASRIVFVSYRDSHDKIQKFGLRFSNVAEAREFINAVEDIVEYKIENEPVNSDFQSEFSCQSVYVPSSTVPSRTETEPLNCDFLSEVSSQSVYIPSSVLPSSSCVGEASDATPIQPYSPELPLSLEYEVQQESFNNESNRTGEGVSAVLPPSFSSLLNICYSESKQGEAEPRMSQESYLKSLIAKYMEDSSFQEMLLKVEKIIGEIGADLM